MITRNAEHELIMKVIYQALVFSEADQEFSLENCMEDTFGLTYDEISIFSKTIIISALKDVNDIKAIYQAKMPKWNFDRLNAVERAILLMSYSHMNKIEGAQKSVIIDVAIRLAKKYLDDSDYKFVNAILDNVL